MTIMNLNDTKKILYKQNPEAEFEYIRKGFAYYNSKIFVPDKEWEEKTDRNLPSIKQDIFFKIPVSDMGNADFTATMSAKLLIRWILETEES